MSSQLREIPGYGGKYRIFDDGRVVRQSDGEYSWVEVAVSPEDSPDARVRLYAPGAGDRPTRRYVRSLLAEVYDLGTAQEYIDAHS